jgi:L-fuconolactonase
MIIDSHQHFWQYSPVKDAWITDDMKIIQRDFMPNELHGILKENKIDGCVAVQADQSENETHFLIELAHKHEFIKGVVGWIDLCADTIEERLAYFSNVRIVKGFRHIVQAEKDLNFLRREDFCRGIGLLEKFNFTYDLLIQPQHLTVATELCNQFPTQKFVVDHLAKPDIKHYQLEPWRKEISNLAKHENVFCKLSGLVTEADWKHWKTEDFTAYLDVVFEAFGADRIMYGSDWPVCLVAARYEAQLSVVRNYLSTFSEAERKKVMGKNAVNFYNL